MNLEDITLGAALKRARVAAGLSTAQVADSTRIRETLITEFENNNFSSSGGNAYSRGHIRTITKLIGVDSDEFISKFNELVEDLDRPMVDLLSENNLVAPKSEKSKISYKTLSLSAAAALVLLAFVPAVTGFFSAPTKSTPSKSSAASAAGDNSTVTVANAANKVTVVITGTQGKSWVGIQDSSGAQVFSGAIREGESKTFTDSAQLMVTVGNAGSVSLTVNGKDLGTPGQTGEVVHLTFDSTSSSIG